MKLSTLKAIQGAIDGLSTTGGTSSIITAFLTHGHFNYRHIIAVSVITALGGAYHSLKGLLAQSIVQAQADTIVPVSAGAQLPGIGIPWPRAGTPAPAPVQPAPVTITTTAVPGAPSLTSAVQQAQAAQ